MVNQAGTHLGIVNPKVMEGAFKTVIQNSWQLLDGTNFILTVNKKVVAGVTASASDVVSSVATNACMRGNSMSDGVMTTGLQRMQGIISAQVTKEANTLLDGAAKKKLYDAAVVALNGEVAAVAKQSQSV